MHLGPKCRITEQSTKIPKLTPSGKDWLVSCLDPYHDFQQTIEGYPDVRSTPSVVQVHNQRVTLTVPVVAGVGNWDCTIWYTGMNYTDANVAYGSQVTASPVNTCVHDYDHAALSPGMAFGSLVYQSGAAGVALDLGAPVVNATRGALASMRTQCNSRLIGVGIEVSNTTSEMYKQGSVTAGMLPDVDFDRNTIKYVDTNGAPWETKEYPSYRCACPASTVAALQNVPSANTWPAARGIYAIPRLQQIEPPVYDCYAAHTAVSYFGPTPVISRVNAGIPVGANGYPRIEGGTPSGFSPLQLYFTGLSNATSLTLTLRTVVEYFPPITTAMGSAASNLLPFVTPSPPYDPKAIALYSATVAKAPYCVPVDMNAGGDYFRMILKSIAAAAPIVSTIFAGANPYVGTAMKVIGVGAKAAEFALPIMKKMVAKRQAGDAARSFKRPPAQTRPQPKWTDRKSVV